MKELRKYETFDSVTELNKYIDKVLTHRDLNKIERKLFWLLGGYSVKVLGVNWLKLDSIATALGVSKRTVQRALKSLIDLGVINRVRTIRPVKGGFRSYITHIGPVELTTREKAPESAPKSTQEPTQKSKAFLFKAFSKDIKYIRQEKEIDYTYLEAYGVSVEFIMAVKYFVKPEEAFSLWQKSQVVASRFAPSVMEITEPAVRAFKATVTAYKFKKIKQSFGTYFWGALQGVFNVEQRRAVAHDEKLWNWLED